MIFGTPRHERRQRFENLLSIQRDLAISIVPATIWPSVPILHGAVLRIDGIAGGGIYLVDPEDALLDLLASAGLPLGFVNRSPFWQRRHPVPVSRSGKG